MSAIESMIWTVLGYLAMPMIFIVGFTGVAVVAMALLNLLGVKSAEQ